jgi:hypothetical protein
MNAALQTAVVMLLLGWSLWALLGRFFPGVAGLLRRRFARLAAVRGPNRLSRALARMPAESGGCDSGCSRCRTGCSTAPAQPLQWRSSSGGH